MTETTYRGWKNGSTENVYLALRDYDEHVYHAALISARNGKVGELIVLTRDYTWAAKDGANLSEVDWEQVIQSLDESFHHNRCAIEGGENGGNA